MSNRSKNKDKHNNLIVGFILIGISLLMLLILCGVFDPAGAYVKNFFLGTFGLSFYGITIACLVIGILKLFRFRMSVPVSRVIELIGIYVLFILAFHATSYEYVGMTSSYGEYISKCYTMADTAGGVLAACIMYPLLKVSSVLGIVVIALLLFGLIAFAMFRGKGSRGAVRTRAVKYGRRDKIMEEEEENVAPPTHVQVDKNLKNEDYNGNKLKEFKGRSRFSKEQKEYTPIEDIENINDEEFKIEYKDNYAYDSKSVEEKDDDVYIVKDDKAESHDDTSKFEKMRNDARIAREKLYGNPYELKNDDVKEDKEPLTDKDKFREAIEKIRNNEDPTYLYNLTSNDDKDYELYSMEYRKKIFRENMEKEKLEHENESIEEVDDVASDNDDIQDDSVVNMPESDTKPFNIEDFKIEDVEEGDFKYDNFEAFKDETTEDNIVDEDQLLSIEPEKDEEIEEDNTKTQDESVNYDIEDFSTSLDKTFEIKHKEESQYDLPFYSRDEQYKKENEKKVESKPIEEPKEEKGPTKRVADIEDELLEEDPKNGNGRKRRSDFGGTHTSQHPQEDSKKQDDTASNSSIAGFINPFAGRKSEEKVEEVKEEPKEEEIKPYVSKLSYKYKAPPIDILNTYEFVEDDDSAVKAKCDIIEEGLAGFGIAVKVVNVIKGPTFSRMELVMEKGTGKSVKAIKNLSTDIQAWLGSKFIDIKAPIPGKTTIGIDFPSISRRTVGLREVFDSKEFNAKKRSIPFALGVDIDGKPYVCDIAKSPHMLIAGATGAGKSVGISCLLNSILYKCSPDEVKLILIDPKKVELNDYRDLPHMLIKEPICEPNQVLNALDWLIDEMERRYTALCEVHASKISEYNEVMDARHEPRMPLILIVIDEVADLMLTLKKSLEDKINKLTAKSRAAGIHLVLATQRPTVDIITGSIKANLPERIAYTTVQPEDSRTILGCIGAEKLLRNGDMIYMDSSSQFTRMQGAFITKKEVVAITDYVRENNPRDFDESIQAFIEKEQKDEEEEIQTTHAASKPDNDLSVDERFVEALEAVINANSASISMLQRKLGIGYPRAGKIHDQLENCGYIQGNKVIITRMQFDEMFNNDDNDEN